MKTRTLLYFVLLCIPMVLSAQVFNTSSTLRKGDFSLGFEPGVYATGDIDPNLFLYGGVGLTNGVDLSLKLGVMGNNAYFGGDVEFALGDYFSFAAGAHSYGNFGLDAMGIFTLPLGKKANFYTGGDMDIVFLDNSIDLPLWIPLGVEIPIKKHILFMFESEVSVTGNAHFIGGGLNFIF